MVSAFLLAPYEAVNSILKPRFRWNLCTKLFDFHIFFFFLVFNHDFIIYIDILHLLQFKQNN